MFRLRSVLVLSDVAVIFLSSIVALTPNGSVLVVSLLLSVSDTSYIYDAWSCNLTIL
jgi:hypothetical protein